MDAQIVAIMGASGAFLAIVIPLMLSWSRHRIDAREAERKALIESYTLAIENLKAEIERLKCEHAQERENWQTENDSNLARIEKLKNKLDEKDTLTIKLVEDIRAARVAPAKE